MFIVILKDRLMIYHKIAKELWGTFLVDQITAVTQQKSSFTCCLHPHSPTGRSKQTLRCARKKLLWYLCLLKARESLHLQTWTAAEDTGDRRNPHTGLPYVLILTMSVSRFVCAENGSPKGQMSTQQLAQVCMLFLMGCGFKPSSKEKTHHVFLSGGHKKMLLEKTYSCDVEPVIGGPKSHSAPFWCVHLWSSSELYLGQKCTSG